jgi:hypothetical protein
MVSTARVLPTRARQSVWRQLGRRLNRHHMSTRKGNTPCHWHPDGAGDQSDSRFRAIFPDGAGAYLFFVCLRKENDSEGFLLLFLVLEGMMRPRSPCFLQLAQRNSSGVRRAHQVFFSFNRPLRISRRESGGSISPVLCKKNLLPFRLK